MGNIHTVGPNQALIVSGKTYYGSNILAAVAIVSYEYTRERVAVVAGVAAVTGG